MLGEVLSSFIISKGKQVRVQSRLFWPIYRVSGIHPVGSPVLVMAGNASDAAMLSKSVSKSLDHTAE